MSSAVAIRATLAVLTDDRLCKAVGWVVVAVLSPMILVVAVICGTLSGAASHNNATVELVFNGGVMSGKVPLQFHDHIRDMRSYFAELDTVIADTEEIMEGGDNLDAQHIKAVCYAIFFGGQRALPTAQRLVDCFVCYEERTRTITELDTDGNAIVVEESYTVAISHATIEPSYSAVAGILGRAVTDTEKKNADKISRCVSEQKELG